VPSFDNVGVKCLSERGNRSIHLFATTGIDRRAQQFKPLDRPPEQLLFAFTRLFSLLEGRGSPSNPKTIAASFRAMNAEPNVSSAVRI
jgi:hypothetical protein